MLFTTDKRRLVCEVELSSTSEASWRSMSTADNDLAINVHICCNGVLGLVGGIWEPGCSKIPFYLPSALFIAQVLVGSSKQLKEIIQTEHMLAKVGKDWNKLNIHDTLWSVSIQVSRNLFFPDYFNLSVYVLDYDHKDYVFTWAIQKTRPRTLLV